MIEKFFGAMSWLWTTGLLYWIPLAVCLVSYSWRTAANLSTDLRARAQLLSGEHRYYTPTLKLGTIVGRLLLAITPGVNLIAAVFDAGGELIGRIISLLERFLDIPIIPEPRR